MKRRADVARAIAASLLTAWAVGGCSRSAGESTPAWCDDVAVLVLAAQSVPTAQLIPCLEAMPIGWSVGHTNIDHTRTMFTLDSKIAGDDAARIELRDDCDVSRHVAVPSDIEGTERFQFIESIETGVVGQRVYSFEGGCVAVDVNFDVDVSAALISEISLALGFVTRDEVNVAVRSLTDGREQVDPPADSGS